VRAAGARVGLVADLVRFPVKSFGGERLRRGFVGPFGLLGDRRIAVVGEDGDIGTARRAHRLLAYAAHSTERESGEGAQVRAPDGRTLAWDDPELARALSADLGRPVRLVRSPASFHDAAPLHLVTDASLTAMEGWLGGEVDRRRFRPNLVVELDDPEASFAEAGWMGRRLALGDGLTVEVVSPTERCAITTFDPDTLERDTRVLAALARERENLFGVYARVLTPGWVAVGDPVVIEPA
jgi:MOSC domain-containing protein